MVCTFIVRAVIDLFYIHLVYTYIVHVLPIHIWHLCGIIYTQMWTQLFHQSKSFRRGLKARKPFRTPQIQNYTATGGKVYIATGVYDISYPLFLLSENN